jgi:hypothetical protein
MNSKIRRSKLEEHIDIQIEENKRLEQILRNQDMQFAALNLPIPEPYDYKYNDRASSLDDLVSLASSSFDDNSSLQSWTSQKSVCTHCNCDFVLNNRSPFKEPGKSSSKQ